MPVTPEVGGDLRNVRPWPPTWKVTHRPARSVNPSRDAAIAGASSVHEPARHAGFGDPELALDWVTELAATLSDGVYGPEVRRLGRTLRRWRHQIAAWHSSRASNGATEATMNNLTKRIKRVAFGITNWTHWRVRVLRYAGKPDWSKLATVSPDAP